MSISFILLSIKNVFTFRLFTLGEESKTNKDGDFESVHMHTLYYLTQAYKNSGDNNKSAEYGHKTLQRQLSTKLYEPADWAINCATLSQFYLTQEDYRSARHCLGKLEIVARILIVQKPLPADNLIKYKKKHTPKNIL